MRPLPRTVAACCRVGDPGRRDVLGSVQEPCCLCGHAVWVAPATRDHVGRAGADGGYVCLECRAGDARLRGVPLARAPGAARDVCRETVGGVEVVHLGVPD